MRESQTDGEDGRISQDGLTVCANRACVHAGAREQLMRDTAQRPQLEQEVSFHIAVGSDDEFSMTLETFIHASVTIHHKQYAVPERWFQGVEREDDMVPT